MKSTTVLLALVAALALLATSAWATTGDATTATTTTTTAAVNENELFRQYQKLKSKVAELEAALPVASSTENGAEAAAVDPKTAKELAKNQRKVDEKRAQLAALEQQLASLNIDVAAKEQEELAKANAAQREREVEAQFQTAWIAKLQADGRTAHADRELQKLTGIKQPKVFQSPAEKAKDKIERLKVKLEREEFRLQWLSQHEQQQAQNTASAAA